MRGIYYRLFIEESSTKLELSVLFQQAEEELARNEKIIRRICAVARSSKSKCQIESDFVAGIKDMHRKASGREDDEDDRVDDDDTDEAFFASKASGFKVFSVSSCDYLKLKVFL